MPDGELGEADHERVITERGAAATVRERLGTHGGKGIKQGENGQRFSLLHCFSCIYIRYLICNKGFCSGQVDQALDNCSI